MKALSGLSGLSGLIGSGSSVPPGSQTASPASAVSRAPGTPAIAWTNPENVLADDASYASVTLLAGEVSEWLDCSQFGFSIPGGATISNLTAEVKAKTLSDTADDDVAVLIFSGASLDDHYGNDQAGPGGVSTTEGYSSAYGGDPGTTWGVTPSVGIVTDATFGFRWAVRNPNPDPVTVRVNHVRVTAGW